jgi:hypothetical protein
MQYFFIKYLLTLLQESAFLLAMKDQFHPKNPMLVGKATIRIALLKPTPESPTGSIISDVKFVPELNYENLNPANMQPHVILAGVATKALREFLDNPNSAVIDHDVNSSQ